MLTKSKMDWMIESCFLDTFGGNPKISDELLASIEKIPWEDLDAYLRAKYPMAHMFCDTWRP